MAAPTLRIPVKVDMGEFSSAMTEMGQRVEDESGRIEGHFASINRAAGVLALGVTVAGGTIVTQLLGMVTSLAKIGDLSDDLRLPVNLIQALSVAATEARIPAKTLTSALEEFTKVSKQAGTDAEKFEKALGNVGASFLKAFKDADSQEERLKIISNALKSTTDEVKRAQLSLQAFGTDNERLIAIMGSGAAAFDVYREKAARLGLEINESMVKQAQEAKSQLLLLSRVLSDEFTGAAGDLIPVLVKLLPYLQAIVLAGKAVGAIFANDATASVKVLKDELDGLVDRWARLKQQEDALANNQSSAADDLAKSVRQGLKDFTGGVVDLTEDASAGLKALRDEIVKTEVRALELRKLIASKDAGSAPDKPAFSGREPPKDKDTSRDRFDAAADAIQKRTAALEAETATIDLGTEARERAKIAAQLMTVAMQVNKEAGVNNGQATQKQIAIIDEFSAAYGRAAAAIEQARSPLNTFARESADVGKALNQFAAHSLDGMTNALADVITGTKSAKDAFKSMANAIIQDLARMAIRQSITGPIANSLAGLFPGGGGAYDVNAGAVPTIGGGWILPGGNAGGTDNWRGGPTWVGERGPELVNLPRGAQVIPNDIARGMGGGQAVNIVVNDMSGHAKVSQQSSGDGVTIEMFIPGIEAMLADRKSRGRGAMAKVDNKSMLRG